MGKQTQYSSERKKASKSKTLLGELLEKVEKERKKLELEKHVKLCKSLYKLLTKKISREWSDWQSFTLKNNSNCKDVYKCGCPNLPKINMLYHICDKIMCFREIRCGPCCSNKRLILELSSNGELSKQNDHVFRDVIRKIMYEWNTLGRRF